MRSVLGFETEYQAVVQSAGLIDLRDRGKVQVEGPDRVAFLHSMISNEVENLDAGAGRYGVFLTATGKLVADFCYYKLPEWILVDLEAARTAPFVETLEKFIIMDDVTLSDVSGHWGHLSLQGPQALRMAGSVLGCEVPGEELHAAPAAFEGAAGWLVRRSWLADAGCDLIFPAAATAQLKALLSGERKVPEVGPEVRETLRVERGIPRFGVDMDERNNPLEARLDSAISYTKGCYIGQEVVAKATYIGGVGRLLTGLKLEGKAVPEKGASVFDSSGKAVGQVTSAVFSPALGRPVALAYLKRAAALSADQFAVELPAGGRASAQVNPAAAP